MSLLVKIPFRLGLVPKNSPTQTGVKHSSLYNTGQKGSLEVKQSVKLSPKQVIYNCLQRTGIVLLKLLNHGSLHLISSCF